MILWVTVGIFIVVGFHVILKFVNIGKSELSTSIHPMRRLQHVFTGLIIAAIFYYVTYEQGKIMITIPAVLFFLFDLIRRKVSPQVNQWFLANWGSLLRPHERFDSAPAAIFFLLGIAAVFWITEDRAIIYLSIFYVSLCDPAASVFGILFGKIKISQKKTLEGTLAASIVGGILSLIVGHAFTRNFSFFFGFLVALVAEVVEIPGLDDNFTIPVISALIWESSKIFPGALIS